MFFSAAVQEVVSALAVLLDVHVGGGMRWSVRADPHYSFSRL